MINVSIVTTYLEIFYCTDNLTIVILVLIFFNNFISKKKLVKKGIVFKKFAFYELLLLSFLVLQFIIQSFRIVF